PRLKFDVEPVDKGRRPRSPIRNCFSCFCLTGKLTTSCDFTSIGPRIRLCVRWMKCFNCTFAIYESTYKRQTDGSWRMADRPAFGGSANPREHRPRRGFDKGSRGRNLRDGLGNLQL